MHSEGEKKTQSILHEKACCVGFSALFLGYELTDSGKSIVLSEFEGCHPNFIFAANATSHKQIY